MTLIPQTRHRKTVGILGLLAGLALLGLLGAAKVVDPTNVLGASAEAKTPQTRKVKTTCEDTPVEHVILIAVDGLQVQGLKQLLAAGKANAFQRLIDQGVSTLNARPDATYSITLPNMTAMMTGRPVTRVQGRPDDTFHGYTWNGPPRQGETLHNGGNPALAYVPSVFDVVHDHGGSTALYASKSKFALFDASWNAEHGAADTVGSDQGRDKIDSFRVDPDTARLTDALLQTMAVSPFRFAFLHLADPDAAGHGIGWGTPTWLAAVQHVDAQIAKVLDFVASQPALQGNTVVIVTSDHGGFANTHFDIANPLIHTIPFFVWGRRVDKGVDAYKALSNRRDPGSARPDFTAKDQPIRNGDACNMALGLLGLPNAPGSTMRDAGLTLTRCPKTRR